jgi:hypothetical protein
VIISPLPKEARRNSDEKETKLSEINITPMEREKSTNPASITFTSPYRWARTPEPITPRPTAPTEAEMTSPAVASFTE